MADILDAAQQTKEPNSPASPPQPQDNPLPAAPSDNPMPNTTEPSQVTPIPAELTSIPASSEEKPVETSQVMDTLLEPKTETLPEASPNEPISTEPVITASTPPPKKGINLNRGVILSVLLLLFVTLPLIAFYTAQQRQIAEIRSRASTALPPGGFVYPSGIDTPEKETCYNACLARNPQPLECSAACSGTQVPTGSTNIANYNLRQQCRYGCTSFIVTNRAACESGCDASYPTDITPTPTPDQNYNLQQQCIQGCTSFIVTNRPACEQGCRDSYPTTVTPTPTPDQNYNLQQQCIYGCTSFIVTDRPACEQGCRDSYPTTVTPTPTPNPNVSLQQQCIYGCTSFIVTDRAACEQGCRDSYPVTTTAPTVSSGTKSDWESCSTPSECTSGVCGLDPIDHSHACLPAPTVAPANTKNDWESCSTSSECTSGICGRDPGDNSRACLPTATPAPQGTKNVGEMCVSSTECASGICGRDPIDNSRACLPPALKNDGETCSTPGECKSGICALDPIDRTHACARSANLFITPTPVPGVPILVSRSGCAVKNDSAGTVKICTFSGGCEGNFSGYCGPSWEEINAGSNGASCESVPAGGTASCDPAHVSCGSWQVDVSINGVPQAGIAGVDQSGCATPGPSCTGPGCSPSGTGTPPPGGQCNNIRVYKNGTALTTADLEKLKTGDKVDISVIGTTASQGRVRVNGGNWAVSTTKDTHGGFTVPFTVPTGTTSFTIEGQLYINGGWQ